MAKTKRKDKKTSAKYKSYEAKGDSVNRKNKFCPKCGMGVFMASHKNRDTCGQCGYTEMKSKKE